MPGRRTHVYLTEHAYATLNDLSTSTGDSMSEVVHQALTIYRWYREVRALGGKVLVERDGKTREIVFG